MENTTAFADGRPFRDFFERLDYDESRERCVPPDPELFEQLPGRFLVMWDRPVTQEDIAQLGVAARVRWVYSRLHLVEVEAQGTEAITSLPHVTAAVPAWKTVGSTRTVAVGLNAICALAARQAQDPQAIYRHDASVGYPILRAPNGGRQLDFDPGLELSTPPALIPVVNLSMGTINVGFPTSVNDIVNLATLGASSEVLVVVAAGNCGGHEGDTMSAWARPGWVLSVGATEDAAGTQVSPYSSRGEPGPDLVAFGQSALDAGVRGTSFAAPRVTHLAKLVVAALVQLGRAVMTAQGQEPIGVPAVGHAIIDNFGDEIWWDRPDSTGILALPLLGVDQEAVDLLVDLTGSELNVRGTPQLVRAMLIAAARPVPDVDTAAAGAGFVDSNAVVDYLASITGENLWQWFGTGTHSEQKRLAALHPCVAADLHDLDVIVGLTGPTVKYDYKTGRWVALPLINDRLREEHPNGWAVDLKDVRV